MLSEDEVRMLIEKEKGFLVDTVDPVERKCLEAFIDGLECVLNE